MDWMKFIRRICLIASVALAIAIVLSFFKPLIDRQKKLRAQEAALRQDIQKEAEQLRMLKLKQQKLREDPRFVEKIAREDWNYAKPGETIFRFTDAEAP